MTETIEISIPVDAAAAPALADAGVRAAMGRMISHVLRSGNVVDEMAQAIADAKAEARANGLTDEDIEDELRIYNAERRGPQTS